MVYLYYMKMGFETRYIYQSSGQYMGEQLNLGGTPLNEAVMAAMEIVPMFQKKNNVQIVNTIFLTDGQGHTSNATYNISSGRYESNLRLGYGRVNVVITDPVTKIQYKMDNKNRSVRDTDIYLRALGDRTGSRVAGFFIVPGTRRSFMAEMRYLTNDYKSIENLWEDLKKNAFTVIDDNHLGYDEFYLISDKKLKIESEELVIDDTMSKAKMKNAFIKNRSSKVANKAMLSRFAEFVS